MLTLSTRYKGESMITAPLTELKAKLLLAGMKHKQLAALLRVNYSTLSAWLNGFASMPLLMEKQIASILIEQCSKRSPRNEK